MVEAMVILNPNSAIIGAISYQNYKKGSNYIFSPYVIVEKLNVGILMFNSLTSALFYFGESTENDVAKRNEELLVNNWFLIEEDFDVYSLAVSVKNLSKFFIRDNGITNFSIFTTSKCNARCYYCFERNNPQYDMSEKTAEDVVKYIKSTAKEKKITLAWFGGEPLYNSKVIDVITNSLSEEGYEYTSTMISNGYLFDEMLINKAKQNWNLKSVQITLDGTEKVYNYCKRYIDAEGINPYKKVLNNIKGLIENNINVQIRVNISKTNTKDIYKLADELLDVFGNHKRLDVYAFPLYENSINDPIDDVDLLNEWISFEKHLEKIGLFKSKAIDNKIKEGHCLADSTSTISIYPDGTLGKCDHAMNKEKIGTIKEGIVNPSLISFWKERKIETQQCKTCVIFPRCKLLKNCPEEKEKCNKSLQTINIIRTVQEMKAAYEKSRTK